MPDGVLVARVSAAAAAGGLIAARPRLLFRWYLHEIRRLEIPEDRGDTVATYPFS